MGKLYSGMTPVSPLQQSHMSTRFLTTIPTVFVPLQSMPSGVCSMPSGNLTSPKAVSCVAGIASNPAQVTPVRQVLRSHIRWI
jgi:hypothetical protein